MRKAFFSKSEMGMSDKLQENRVAKCGLCKLYKKCLSPCMKPHGKGQKKILFIAEAPGKEEDEQGLELVGESGQMLRYVLDNHGVDFDRDCRRTNAVTCRPPFNDKPKTEQIEACRPNIVKEIMTFKPNVIILLGGVAVESLIGMLYKDRERDLKIGQWASFQIPCQRLNAWICPTYHPAYLLRQGNKALNRLFVRDIKRAIRLKSKPFREVPDYKSQIEILTNPSKAARLLKVIAKDFDNKRNKITYDYESNCLKPEREKAEIVTCSVCVNNLETISFPFADIVKEPFFKMVRNRARKIAQNIKFESRWTRYAFGKDANNWYWDTMVTAHILDSRPGVTSLNFQAFTKLGLPIYDEHIAPYLKQKGKSPYNRIHELDMRDLLLYGGLDSRVTSEVQKFQEDELERFERWRQRRLEK